MTNYFSSMVNETPILLILITLLRQVKIFPWLSTVKVVAEMAGM